MTRTWKTGTFASILGSLTCMFIGCSTTPQADYSQLGLVEISGTLSLDGEPLPRAAIYFYRPDETYSYGITDAAGRYVAMLNSEKSGVIPGEARIEISTVNSPIPGGLTNDHETGDGEPFERDPDHPNREKGRGERIPDCYNSKSQLKINITSSDPDLGFNLNSDCSTSQPDS